MTEYTTQHISEEIQKLKEELQICQELVRKNIVFHNFGTDKWLSICDLIDYLPDKTARATIYGWVSQGLIPYHKYGKKLTFLKSEIDEWLYNNVGATMGKNDILLSSKKIEPFR